MLHKHLLIIKHSIYEWSLSCPIMYNSCQQNNSLATIANGTQHASLVTLIQVRNIISPDLIMSLQSKRDLPPLSKTTFVSVATNIAAIINSDGRMGEAIETNILTSVPTIGELQLDPSATPWSTWSLTITLHPTLTKEPRPPPQIPGMELPPGASLSLPSSRPPPEATDTRSTTFKLPNLSLQ